MNSIKLSTFLAALLLGVFAFAQNQEQRTSAPNSTQALDVKPQIATIIAGKPFLGDLRSIAKGPLIQREIPERHRIGFQRGVLEGIPNVDWMLQVPIGPIVRAPVPTPTITFEGLDFANFGAGSPPDTVGDVGPNHFIQSVNSSIGIYRKSDGVRVVGLTLDAFMSQGAFGNICDTENFGDPVVLYDSFEDRWIITDFAFQLDGGNNVINPPGMLQCFAVSRSGDPVSGGWNFYSFNTTGGLGDYGKFAIWPDGLYMTFNMFAYASGGGYQNARVYAFDKMKMYAGDPNPGLIRFDLPANEFTVLPSNARLQTGTPPAGSPNYYVSNASFFNSVQLYKFAVNWSAPVLSTFTGPSNAAIPTYADPPGTVPSGTGGAANDTLGSRLMMQNQYVNLAGTESLWNSFTVLGSSASQAAVYWAQLNITGGTLAASAVQAAVHNPDTESRYIPSLAVDRAGNMAVGYSLSGATTRPAIRYAGRFASDVVNTLPQTEQVLINGAGTKTSGNRWGDYATMTLDPVDGCTFWFTTEYFQANGTAWNTRIGSFRYPTANCTSVASGGSLTGTVTAVIGGAPIANAIVQLGARAAVTNNAGVYSFGSLPAGSYQLETASANGYVNGSQANIVIGSGVTTQNFALSLAATGTQCFTDTTLVNFQTGITSGNINLTGGGNVQLSNAAAVDQSNATLSTSGNGITAASWSGQTFTAGLSGTVPTVTFNAFCSSCTGTAPTYTVSIRATVAGLPTGPDLAAATVVGNTSGAASNFAAIFSSPAAITAGTVYAIAIRASTIPSAGIAAITRSAASVYAGGTRVTSGDTGVTWTAPLTSGATTDIGFQVFVNTGFQSPGDFTSNNKFANSPVGQQANWTLASNGTAPASTTLRVQLAGSDAPAGPFNFVGPDNTASTFFAVPLTTSGVNNFRGFRYLRYKAFLTTSSGAVTPVLNDLTLCYSNTPVTSTDSGFQVGRVSLNATINGTNRLGSVRFSKPFALPPVVIVQPSNDNLDPASLRIASVRRDGFDVIQVEAPGCGGCTGLGGAVSVDWLAASPGSYRLPRDTTRITSSNRGSAPGPLVKVGIVTTNSHQRGPGTFTSWALTSWTAVSFPTDVVANTFTDAPVVLSTVQTWNNEGPNLLGPVTSLRNSSANWETTVMNNVTSTGFDVALEVSEVNDDDAGIPGLDNTESIGYVAIERPVSVDLFTTSGTPLALATGQGTANDTCDSTVLTGMTFPTAPALANLRGFVGKQSRNDTDGGWLRRCVMTTPSGNAVSMTVDVDEDDDGDVERTHTTAESMGAAIFGGDFISSPVTLAQISTRSVGSEQLEVQFSVATEVSHLGYRVWGRVDADSQWRVLSELIPAQGGDSMQARSYRITVDGNAVNEIRIEDLDLLGRSRFQTPIAVGQSLGSVPIEVAIDWNGVQRESRSNLPQRRIGQKPEAIAYVRQDGVQRVRFETLQALGWPSNQNSSTIALIEKGRAIPRVVHCENFAATTFGPGCYLEWLGQARVSLYGPAKAYRIVVAPSSVIEVSRGAIGGPALANNIPSFSSRYSAAPNRQYSFSAPGAEPWYDERILARTAPVSVNRSFDLPELVTGPAALTVNLWGGLDFAGVSPDHSVEIVLNGRSLGSQRFDGLTAADLQFNVDANALRDRDNQLSIRVLADTGYTADLVLLDGFSVQYQRRARADVGQLQFGSFGTAIANNDLLFQSGFELGTFDLRGVTGNSVLWTEHQGRISRDLINQDTRLLGDVNALMLTPENQVASPEVIAAAPVAVMPDNVDYLIVTHPQFEAELAPLLALQRQRGYRTTVLRTNEIYALESGNEADPDAIARVIAQIRPRFVLLVGGDSYDYHNYLGLGTQSFLPTFYRRADEIVRFAASDAYYADFNRDGAPDTALARIPARTNADLARAIESIIERSAQPALRYFASAGNSSGSESFAQNSRANFSYLRQTQVKSYGLVDEIGFEDSQQATRAALAGGADWINYVGHSSPNRWALQNLLDTQQLNGIVRSGPPAIISQWGCWNNYFVLPNQDTMSYALMFRSNQLASAVIGSTSLAEDASHMVLANRFFDLVEDGQFDERGGNVNTIGEALMYAKRDLAETAPDHIESNYSIVLFGDPAQPLR